MRVEYAETLPDETAPAPQSLTTLRKAFSQEFLGAVSALLFLLLNLSEEGGEILISASIAGVLLVQVRSLERMIQNADKVIGSVFSTGAIGHGSVSSGMKTLAQSLAGGKVPVQAMT
jgi:hypothetical protein